MTATTARNVLGYWAYGTTQEEAQLGRNPARARMSSDTHLNALSFSPSGSGRPVDGKTTKKMVASSVRKYKSARNQTSGQTSLRSAVTRACASAMVSYTCGVPAAGVSGRLSILKVEPLPVASGTVTTTL